MEMGTICLQIIVLQSLDILRIPKNCQNYRYAKKTQISLDPKKCRYVGVITAFLVRRYFGFPDDIHNYLRFFKYSRNPHSSQSIAETHTPAKVWVSYT
jgi:hypothetical protein